MLAVATPTRRKKPSFSKAQLSTAVKEKGIELSPIVSKEEMAKALSVEKPLNTPSPFGGEY